jgi:hypothetical protein
VSTSETPGGSAIPAGWYDDPSGAGLRWWDGEQWTEHVHTPESAAAAGGASPDGSREGKPPRELVKLRERIRARGIKGVGIVLGAIVVVIVVIALLVSGGGESSNANPTPGAGNTPTKAATGKQAQIKKIDKQLQNKNLSKQKRKQLEAQKKKLEKGSGKSKAKGGGKKKVSPGEEGN